MTATYTGSGGFLYFDTYGFSMGDSSWQLSSDTTYPYEDIPGADYWHGDSCYDVIESFDLNDPDYGRLARNINLSSVIFDYAGQRPYSPYYEIHGINEPSVIHLSAVPVPEPSLLLLMGSGVSALGLIAGRRKIR